MTPTRTAGSYLGTALLACAVAACVRASPEDVGPLPGTAEAEAAGRLAAGASALDLGNFSAARTDLGWVYTRCPATEDGQAALLLLGTSYLDPRNEDRRPDLAAAIGAHVVGLAPSGSVLASSGAALYLLASEHGAPPARSEPLRDAAREVREAEPGCSDGPARVRLTLIESASAGAEEEGTAAADWLPTPPAATVPGRIAAVTEERDSLATLVAELEEQVRALSGRVAVQQQELERIRRTLRP